MYTLVRAFSNDKSSRPTGVICKNFDGTIMAHHLVETKPSTEPKLRYWKKNQWNLSRNNAFYSRIQLCFRNIIECAKGLLMIRLTVTCWILSFQISTSVNLAMAAVHISVLTHMAPIVALVEMASGCIQTITDVTVSLTFFLPILHCFFEVILASIHWAVRHLGSAAAEVSVNFRAIKTV